MSDSRKVPCPECGASGKTANGSVCPKCEGKARIDDWGSSVLDALESRVANEGEGLICPGCERGTIVGGVCDHCETPYQSPSRTEWTPHQISPRDPRDERAYGDNANYHAKVADASMPPETQMPQHEVAAPYNPAIYDEMAGSLHPAAQYTYQRAVQQGANPQAAMADAQAKQQEMMQRQLQGQDTRGVEQPVIGKKADDVNKNPLAEIIDSDFDGFVPQASIRRVSHLLS